MPITRISPPPDLLVRIAPSGELIEHIDLLPGDPQVIYQGASSVVRLMSLFLADVLARLILIEAGGGPATGAHLWTHVQSAPAAVWTITHTLATKPGVVIVSSTGALLLAEIHYPDDATVVVIHGAPYSGTAYLRA